MQHAGLPVGAQRRQQQQTRVLEEDLVHPHLPVVKAGLPVVVKAQRLVEVFPVADGFRNGAAYQAQLREW